MKTGSGNTLSGWERGMNIQLDSPTGEESEAYDQVVQFDRSEYERFDFFLEERWGENVQAVGV